METDEKSWQEKCQDKDNQYNKDRFRAALNQQVDNRSQACQQKMRTNSVKSTNRLRISRDDRLFTQVLTIPSSIAVRISSQIYITHTIGSHQIEEIVSIGETSRACRWIFLSLRSLWTNAVEDVIWNGKPSCHEGTGNHTAKIFEEKVFNWCENTQQSLWRVSSFEIPLYWISRDTIVESFFDESETPYSLNEDQNCPESSSSRHELVKDILSWEVDGRWTP